MVVAKRILGFIVVILICALVFWLYIDNEAEKSAPEAMKVMEPIFEVTKALIEYRTSKKCWPESVDKLQTFAMTENIPFDRSKFSKLSLETEPDGTLTMAYELATPLQSSGKISFSDKFEEQKSEPQSRY